MSSADDKDSESCAAPTVNSMLERFRVAIEVLSMQQIAPMELVSLSMNGYDIQCHLSQEGLLRIAKLLNLTELTYLEISPEQLRCSAGSINYVAIVDDDFRKEFESQFTLTKRNLYDVFRDLVVTVTKGDSDE